MSLAACCAGRSVTAGRRRLLRRRLPCRAACRCTGDKRGCVGQVSRASARPVAHDVAVQLVKAWGKGEPALPAAPLPDMDRARGGHRGRHAQLGVPAKIQQAMRWQVVVDVACTARVAGPESAVPAARQASRYAAPHTPRTVGTAAGRSQSKCRPCLATHWGRMPTFQHVGESPGVAPKAVDVVHLPAGSCCGDELIIPCTHAAQPRWHCSSLASTLLPAPSRKGARPQTLTAARTSVLGSLCLRPCPGLPPVCTTTCARRAAAARAHL